MTAPKQAFEAPPQIGWRRRLSRRVLVLATLVIAGLAMTGYLISRSSSSRVESGTRALIEAFAGRRLIEPRLSGGFKRGEYNPSREDSSGVDTRELNRARELIQDALAQGDPKAELAYARLLASENGDLVEAIRYLRLALAASPESAEAHNDFGVCLMQQHKLEDALVEFEAALDCQADMPEAIFNRALCYQRLLLRAPARDDYRRAARIERDREWLDEIKRRLDDVSRSPEQRSTALDPIAEFDSAFAASRLDDAARIADQNSESLRTHAIWDVPILYLQQAAAGDATAAQRAMSELEFIGSVLTTKMQDSVAADLAAYLRNVSGAERGAELELIKQYVGAARSKEPGAHKLPIFERLEQRFRQRGNAVFETLSAFKIADYYYESKRFYESLTKLKAILSSPRFGSWPFDRARFLNELALETSRIGQDSLAIKYFQQAVSLCGESPNLESRILQYMSVPHIQLGDLDAALACLRDSTNLFFEHAPQQTLQNLAYNYSQIASVYSLRNQHRLARLYAQQALEFADQGTFHDYAAEFSSFLAVENARLDRLGEAEAYLNRAFGHLEQIDAGRAHDRTEARVLISLVEVAWRAGDVKRALDYCARAEPLAAADETNALLTIDLLRARANAYAAAGQNQQARADLLSAVSGIENYRANIATSDQRSHFLDASHGVFDQLISLDIDVLNLPAEAFEMSERSRARALLDEISRGPIDERPDSRAPKPSPASVPPLPLAKVRSSLPSQLTLLQYSVTSAGTFLFVTSNSRFVTAKSPATTEKLDDLTRRYISALKSNRSIDEVSEMARELYDYLIRPVEQHLQPGAGVCIVPDKALHFLPFAGLIDESGKYLLESLRLSYAPSASVLVRCLEEDNGSTDGSRERILAVGNPRFDRTFFPNLQPLTDAEYEAAGSAKLYDSSSVTLLGAQATEQTVRAALRECEVAHLALHCLVEESSPWLAALVLAGARPPQHQLAPTAEARGAPAAALIRALPNQPALDPNDGLLYLNELYGMKLPRTRLVVLSACQTGLGQYYRGEGIVSLVRPLLAAGVPTVVASLWPVDSKATSELMIEFHKQRKVNALQASEALRRAQLALARSYKSPYYWAPFILVGSSAASM
jgi:CHAT domain-containing protein